MFQKVFSLVGLVWVFGLVLVSFLNDTNTKLKHFVFVGSEICDPRPYLRGNL